MLALGPFSVFAQMETDCVPYIWTLVSIVARDLEVNGIVSNDAKRSFDELSV